MADRAAKAAGVPRRFCRFRRRPGRRVRRWRHRAVAGDAGIIRNRLKIAAVVDNARRIQQLRTQFGSFDGWLRAHHPRSPPEWVRLFKQNFRFTGGEIVGEFLMSLGYLPGAHEPDCPAYARIRALTPPWAEIGGIVSVGK